MAYLKGKKDRRTKNKLCDNDILWFYLQLFEFHSFILRLLLSQKKNQLWKTKLIADAHILNELEKWTK